MTVDEKKNRILQECANNAVYAYGTSYVYGKRYGKHQKWSQISRISGFLIPIIVGTIFLNYSNESSFLAIVIYIGTPLSVIQGAFAGYIEISRNDDKVVEYVKLSTKNRVIAEEFHDLVKYPPEKIKDLEVEFNRLRTKERELEEADETHRITEKEERMKMRYGLYCTGRQCQTCNERPMTMAATNCNVCGNF